MQAASTVTTCVCPAYPSSIRFKPVAATIARYFARALQKRGDYATQTSQLYSATTEELFERDTLNQVQVYGAEGHSHPPSDLVRLSRGCIPFPPRFAPQNDLVQKQAFLQSLKVQNICCTFGDWVKLGRIPESLFDQRDGKGQWLFLSMEGSQLRTDLSASLSWLNS